MLFKLALRNVKRTASSYIIYFITVAFTVSFMFAANNVLLSDDLRANDAVVRSDLGMIINIVLAVVVIIVGLIICSATAYLMRLRRREFGTYLLLGMKRGDVIKIFAVEHLTVGVVSLAAGLGLGVGVFYAFNGLICAVIGSGIRPLSLMPVPSLQTLLEWACIFAVALLFAGIASTITSGMAAGSIFAGMFKEPYDIKDTHSRTGVVISLIVAFVIIIAISNPFKGLIYSQMALSIQLPVTVFTQVYLTSSEKVMGKFRNSTYTKYLLYTIGVIVTVLNLMLLWSCL